ncbi:TIGR03086 family metal-binding protein [Actinoplanes subtropicus]|uniref:TIGR03086 family metal-binding protein n=1 Tax=Actinoplanes subtropicus TaxID=543632 RepID=UPI0004C3D604|nr:TIGR03086 family metal-binding protein [Actinoplanes subtropicus]
MHTDLIAADAVAVRETVRLVAGLTAADLSRPTPCEGWDLGTLLAHMTVQNQGFAGSGSWEMPPGGRFPDSVRTYAASAELVMAAFAVPGALDRPVSLPEISPQPFPGRVAIGFHLVDYVVHGWDVATALGVPLELPLSVVEATLPLARAVPDGPLRLEPGAAFAPALPVPADAEPLTEILLRLGRKIVGGS